jgi:hypothetical protein
MQSGDIKVMKVEQKVREKDYTSLVLIELNAYLPHDEPCLISPRISFKGKETVYARKRIHRSS